MEHIFRGVERFQNDVFPKERALYESLANRQEPLALMVACSDSRVDPNHITQTKPGELFVCRNAGNIVPPWGAEPGGVSATIEYGVMVLNVEAIIVCGHSDCGAMKALMDHRNVEGLPAVSKWLHNAERARAVVEHLLPDADPHERLRVMTEQNVMAQIDHLRTHPSVAARMASGKLQLLGLVFDIGAGQVRWFNGSGKFVPSSEMHETMRATGVLAAV